MNELNDGNFVDFFSSLPEERQLIWLKTIHKEEINFFYTYAEELLSLALSPIVKAKIICLYTQACQQKKLIERSSFIHQLQNFSLSTEYQLKLAAKSALSILKDDVESEKKTGKIRPYNLTKPAYNNSFNKTKLSAVIGLAFLLIFGHSYLKQKNTTIIEFKPLSTFVPYATKNSPLSTAEHKEKISLSTVTEINIEKRLKPESKNGSKNEPKNEPKTELRIESKSPAIVIPEFSKTIVWDIGQKPKSNVPAKLVRESKGVEATIELKTYSESKTNSKPEIKKENKEKTVIPKNLFSYLRPGTDKQLIIDELANLPLREDENTLKISSRLLDEPAECQLLFLHNKLHKTECLIKIAQRDPGFPLQGWGKILQEKLTEEGLKVQANPKLKWMVEGNDSKYLLQLSESAFQGIRIFSAELKSEITHK